VVNHSRYRGDLCGLAPYVARRPVTQTGSAVTAGAISFLRKRAGTASESGFLKTDRVDADPTDKG